MLTFYCWLWGLLLGGLHTQWESVRKKLIFLFKWVSLGDSFLIRHGSFGLYLCQTCECFHGHQAEKFWSLSLRQNIWFIVFRHSIFTLVSHSLYLNELSFKIPLNWKTSALEILWMEVFAFPNIKENCCMHLNFQKWSGSFLLLLLFYHVKYLFSKLNTAFYRFCSYRIQWNLSFEICLCDSLLKWVILLNIQYTHI